MITDNDENKSEAGIKINKKKSDVLYDTEENIINNLDDKDLNQGQSHIDNSVDPAKTDQVGKQDKNISVLSSEKMKKSSSKLYNHLLHDEDFKNVLVSIIRFIN